MALSKERINEVAYAILVGVLSKEYLKFDPEELKRKLGNLPQKLQHLPDPFKSISKEELQEACKVISHDLVDYAFDFTWGKEGKKKKKKK